MIHKTPDLAPHFVEHIDHCAQYETATRDGVAHLGVLVTGLSLLAFAAAIILSAVSAQSDLAGALTGSSLQSIMAIIGGFGLLAGTAVLGIAGVLRDVD